MGNLSKFCTCRDTKCPLHPTNHDKGCSPCISKNLRLREAPNCYFNLIGDTQDRDSYYIEDFARAVLEKSED